MTPSLSAIQQSVEADLIRFETMYSKAFLGASVPMEEVLSYVDSAKEKRLRPMLVFLSAKLLGETCEATMRAALFVEMIHTAALVHNNVMDNTDVPTAVLAGDFLLSKAMLLMTGPDDLPLLREMLSTALSMSEGELMQKVKSEKWSAESYSEAIKKKTAMLFRACCMGGAMSVGASKEQVALAGDFGLNLGMVYQLRNDLVTDEDAATTKMAETLLPAYREKTIAALEALKAGTEDLSVELLESLRALTLFCAERSQ